MSILNLKHLPNSSKAKGILQAHLWAHFPLTRALDSTRDLMCTTISTPPIHPQAKPTPSVQPKKPSKPHWIGCLYKTKNGSAGFISGTLTTHTQPRSPLPHSLKRTPTQEKWPMSTRKLENFSIWSRTKDGQSSHPLSLRVTTASLSENTENQPTVILPTIQPSGSLLLSQLPISKLPGSGTTSAMWIYSPPCVMSWASINRPLSMESRLIPFYGEDQEKKTLLSILKPWIPIKTGAVLPYAALLQMEKNILTLPFPSSMI